MPMDALANDLRPRHQSKSVRSAVVGMSLICACLFSGCGGGAGDRVVGAAPETPAAGNLPAVAQVGAGTWVIMGSSTAAGNGATPGNSWSQLLQGNLADRNAQIQNIAKPGTVTYHGLSSASTPVANRPAPDPATNIDQALSRNPVVLLLAYPTNDTAAGYSVDETVNNILAIRSAALGKHVPVLVLSTQPRNLSAQQLAQLGQIDAKLVSSIGACFVNVHSPLAGADDQLAPGYNSGDGIHPNDAGHRVIADTIMKTINSNTCIQTQNR